MDYILARGTDFPDALAASQVGGQQRAPMLLTDSYLPAEARNLLQARSAWATRIFVMGGPGSVPEDVVARAVSAATS